MLVENHVLVVVTIVFLALMPLFYSGFLGKSSTKLIITNIVLAVVILLVAPLLKPLPTSDSVLVQETKEQFLIKSDYEGQFVVTLVTTQYRDSWYYRLNLTNIDGVAAYTGPVLVKDSVVTISGKEAYLIRTEKIFACDALRLSLYERLWYSCPLSNTQVINEIYIPEGAIVVTPKYSE